ncbi:unnamed protein product [Sphagnum jensenii]|uniref:Uncharacterized protein n=1 Tax=Sphagnum jensenii TaxID=128206 RepID=A0ABP1C1A9_9BRYO
MRHLIPSPVLDAQLNPIPCPILILMGCNACLLGSRLDLDSTDIVSWNYLMNHELSKSQRDLETDPADSCHSS